MSEYMPGREECATGCRSAGPRGPADEALGALCCPACAGPLAREAVAAVRCRRCRAEYPVDEHGILHFTDRDFYYREIDRDRLRDVLSAGPEGFLRRFYQIVAPPDGYVNDWLQNYVLGQTRAAGLGLLDLGPDTVAVDYGCGWGNLSRMLSLFCRHVISIDMTLESLVFSSMLTARPNLTYVRGGEGALLPLAPGSVDAVILNGVLEWLPEGARLDMDPRRVHVEFLQQVRAALKPGGQVFIAIENRYGALYWLGQREDHTGLRFGAILPRPLSDVYSRLIRKKPYRTYTYSYQAYRSLLADAGFQGVTIYHPWHDYRDIQHIHPRHTLSRKDVQVVPVRGSGLKRVARRLANTVGRAVGIHRLTPAFLIVGQAGGQERPGLIERVLAQKGERLADVQAIDVSNTGAWMVRTGARFYKIPFTESCRARNEQHYAASETLSREFPGLARFVMPTERLAGVGLSALVFPLAAAARGDDPRPARVIGDFLAAADRLAVEASVPFERHVANLVPYFAEVLGKESELQEIARRLAARAWRAGPLHGDLHSGNVLLLPDGSCVLTDWDHFEPGGPLVFDRLHYCMMETANRVSPCVLRGETPLKETCTGIIRSMEAVTRADIAAYLLIFMSQRLGDRPHYAFPEGGHLRTIAEEFLRAGMAMEH